MTNFVNDFDTRYSTYEEIDAMVAKARVMRARAMREGAASVWTLFQDAVTRRPASIRGCKA